MTFIARLVRHFEAAQVRTVLVEAGHVYLNERPDATHLDSCRVGAELRDAFRSAGFGVTTMLYVDDYSVPADMRTLDLRTYLETIGGVGFEPDLVLMESTMATCVPEFLERLIRPGGAVLQNGQIRHGRRRIRVEGPRADYSCALCEACLLELKMSTYDLALTVLPAQFRAQQQTTYYLLRAAGHREIRTAVLYLAATGRRVEIPSADGGTLLLEETDAYDPVGWACS